MVAGNVGEDGGEVESRALPHRRQDGWRRVRGQGGGVVWQAHWRAQVALVGRDAGVEGWRDEGGWFVRWDDERLGARSALEFGFSVFIQSWIAFPILDRQRIEDFDQTFNLCSFTSVSWSQIFKSTIQCAKLSRYLN